MRFSTVSFVLFASTIVSAQLKDDTINFREFGPFEDLKRCLKAVFIVDYPVNDGKNVPTELGCTTNACLCRPDTLAEAIELGGSKAAEFCSNVNDQKSATSLFTAYCSEQGYTAMPSLPTQDPESNNIAEPTSSSPPSNRVDTPARTTENPIVQQTSIVSTISGSAVTIVSTVTAPPAGAPTQQGEGSKQESKPNLAGPIAGGVVGGLALIGAIIGIVICMRRRSKSDDYEVSHGYVEPEKGMGANLVVKPVSPPSYDSPSTTSTGNGNISGNGNGNGYFGSIEHSSANIIGGIQDHSARR